jgi:YVTN family beta-propeller protein
LYTYTDMKKYILYVFAGVSLLTLGSCDDKPKATDEVVIPPPINGSVMIINEGNYTFGNSSLTVLNFSNGELYQDVFAKNNSRPLGDVFQSIAMANGKAYFVVNNSQKIEVVDPSTYKSIATINGFTSPRYLQAVNPNKAYVTEYYANAIRIVDLNTNAIIGSIPLNGWCDEMVLVDEKVYVTNFKRDYVYIINTADDSIADSVKVVEAPLSIQVDAQHKVWVLSNGKMDNGIRPAIQCINPATLEVEKTFSLTMSETDVSRLRINKAKTRLYWLSKHVYALGIEEATVSSTPFIRSINNTYYGLGVDPRTDELYVSDAKDFVQRSNITRFNSSGIPVGDFTADLITGGFFFYYP